MYSFEKKINPNESNMGGKSGSFKMPHKASIDHGNIMEAYCKVKCFKYFNINKNRGCLINSLQPWYGKYFQKNNCLLPLL